MTRNCLLLLLLLVVDHFWRSYGLRCQHSGNKDDRNKNAGIVTLLRNASTPPGSPKESTRRRSTTTRDVPLEDQFQQLLRTKLSSSPSPQQKEEARRLRHRRHQQDEEPSSFESTTKSSTSDSPLHSPRIINGQIAAWGRYPYMASLRIGQLNFCGGTLIVPNLILSAAHCLDALIQVLGQTETELLISMSRNTTTNGAWQLPSSIPLAVQINPPTLSDPLGLGETFGVKKILPHPQFDESTFSNDVLIVELDGNSLAPVIRLNLNQSVPESPDVEDGDGGNQDSAKGQQLIVMGWGVTEQSGFTLSQYLREARVEYIDNADCATVALSSITMAQQKQQIEGHYGGGAKDLQSALVYLDHVREDMMCAIEDATGSCQGDSGGPLIVAGDNYDEDLQVGVVSWGVGCAQAIYPGVFARLSHESNWGFIQQSVCDHSYLPLDYFKCNQTVDGGGAPITVRGEEKPAENPALSPSSSPSEMALPPATNTSQKVPITLVIYFDGSPEEIGWKLEEVQDGMVFSIIGQVPIGSYSSVNNDPLMAQETFLVSLDGSFRFTLEDQAMNGMCCGHGHGNATIYFGSKPNSSQALAFDNGQFEGQSSKEFIVSPATIIPETTIVDHNGGAANGSTVMTIVVETYQTEEYSQNITWLLERIDGPDDGSSPPPIAQVPRGTYSVSGMPVDMAIPHVHPGGLYRFTIWHFSYYGFAGYYEIRAGPHYDKDSNHTSLLILSEPGTQVKRQSTHKFIFPKVTQSADDDQTPDSFLTLEIKFDAFPSEVEWYLYSVDSNEVLAFGPHHSHYVMEFSGKTIHQIIPLDSVANDDVRSYRLVWSDTAEDGICCRFGEGYLRLWEGDIDSGELLASSENSSHERGQRVLSFERRGVSATTSPHQEENKSHPSSFSPSPDGRNIINITLIVQVDDLESQTETLGWRILQSDTGMVVNEMLPGGGTNASTTNVLLQHDASLSYRTWTFQVYNSTGEPLLVQYILSTEIRARTVEVASGYGRFDSPRAHQFGFESATASYPVTVTMRPPPNDGTIVGREPATEWLFQRFVADNHLSNNETFVQGIFWPHADATGGGVATVLLEEGELYRILFHNRPSPNHYVVVGSANEDGAGEWNSTSSIPAESLNNFTAHYPTSLLYSFVTSPGNNNSSPIVAREMLLELKFGVFPQGVSWLFLTGKEQGFDSVDDSHAEEIIGFGPKVSFGTHLSGQSVATTIPISPIAARSSRRIKMLLWDEFGDGITGYTLWNGFIPLSLSSTVGGTRLYEADFVLSQPGLGEPSSSMPMFPAATPFQTDVPTLQSSIMAPGSSTLQILVTIEPKRSPETISWQIVEPSSSAVLARADEGTYASTGTHTTSVILPQYDNTSATIVPFRFVMQSNQASPLETRYTISSDTGIILASGNEKRKTSRVHDFFASSSRGNYPISIAMDIGLNDSGSGWILWKITATDAAAGALVAQSENLPVGGRAHATVMVEAMKNIVYRLEIRNGAETAFVSHYIVEGSAHADQGGQPAILPPPDLYSGYSTSIWYNILPNPTSEQSATRSNWSLTLELDIHNSPETTLWLMLSSGSVTSTTRSNVGDAPELHAYGPRVSYGSNQASSIIRENIPLPPFEERHQMKLVFSPAIAAPLSSGNFALYDGSTLLLSAAFGVTSETIDHFELSIDGSFQGIVVGSSPTVSPLGSSSPAGSDILLTGLAGSTSPTMAPSPADAIPTMLGQQPASSLAFSARHPGGTTLRALAPMLFGMLFVGLV